MDAFPVSGVLKRGAALIALVVMLAVAPSVSAAADEVIPDDVVAEFSAEAVQSLKKMNAEELLDKDSNAPDLSEISGFGEIRTVYQWSEEFLRTGVTDHATVALSEWVAPILDSGGSAVGLYRVWRPEGTSMAEFAGYNADSETAREIQKTAHSAVIISDPSIGGWYSLSGGQLNALNRQAAIEVPYPEALESVAPIISKRHNEMIRQSKHEDSAGGATIIDRRPWFYGLDLWLVAGAALLVAVGLVGITYFSRRARGRG